MALPSLRALSLCPVGMQAAPMDYDDDDGVEMEVDELPPPSQGPVQRLVSNALGRVTEQLVNAPWMLCLQDKDDASLAAARRVKAFLKQYRTGYAGTRQQFDDKADQDRYNAAVAAGKRVAVVTLYKPQILRYIEPPLALVRQRLARLMDRVATDLDAHIWTGNPNHPRNNMGFEVTYTSEYGEADYFPFHTDMKESGEPAHLPQNVGDWIFLTMVYYLLDADAEALARERIGHGSTLYNLSQTPRPDDDTRVAFCPLANGAITIFNGSKYHAVGPNFGIERGAVVLKIVLYKRTPYRVWTHDQWWQRVQASILRLACARGSNFRHNKHGEEQLCRLLQPPAGV